VTVNPAARSSSATCGIKSLRFRSRSREDHADRRSRGLSAPREQRWRSRIPNSSTISTVCHIGVTEILKSVRRDTRPKPPKTSNKPTGKPVTGLSPSAIAVLWVFGLFLLIGIVAVIGGASNNRATTPQTNTYSPSSSVPSDASPPPQPSQRSQLEAPAPAPTAEPNMVAAAAPSMAPEAPQQSAPIPENVERALAVRGYSGESELGASVVLKKGELLQVWLNDPAINYTEVKTGKGELLWVSDLDIKRVP